jgi:hypothetical protein
MSFVVDSIIFIILYNFYNNMISSSLFRTGRLDLKKIHSQKLSEKIAFVGFVLHKVRREFMRVGGGKVLYLAHERQ